MPTVIAVDAMGSDRAPKPEVEGAILAARHHAVEILLVGREDQLRRELAHHPSAADLPIQIVPATQVIGMEEKAAQAVRSKRDSSMRVALRQVREGRAHGFITAGNTGAAMASAKMTLGGLPGVDRPALAAIFPTSTGSACVVLDVGANVDCKPHHLEQFAIMGEIFYRTIFSGDGSHRVRVGLLSIGEEESKGNELTRHAYQRLKHLPLNFIGNVEGRDLYNGHADVVVCDGFIGNVALKVSEGLVETIRSLLKESLQSTITRQVGFLLSRKAYDDFKKRLDYSEYGGAPLLGVKGCCIIGHGSSNANAMKNAIRVAAELVTGRVNEVIEQEIASLRSKGRVWSIFDRT